MNLKEKTKIGDIEENLQVVLHETLAAADKLSCKAKKFLSLQSDSEHDDGRYGELAAQAFLLKLKAEALQEILEAIIEAQPDEN